MNVVKAGGGPLGNEAERGEGADRPPQQHQAHLSLLSFKTSNHRVSREER